MGRRDDDIEGIRIKRDVLRRVVSEKLESLLRGDFYVRNHLGEDSYDPIVTEVRNFLWSDPSSSSSRGGGGVPQSQPGQQQQQQNNPQQSQSQQQQQSPPPFSEELDKFIQIIAASIMIDASMRGENAGESDPRYIKKRKKLLAKTLKGTKFHSFCKEILRFEQRRKGEKVDDEDEVEYEEEDEEEKDPESEDEDDASRGENGKGGKHGSSDSASSDHEDSHLSDTSATSLSKSGAEDGFSTSATSSKHHKKKKEKKRRKKEKKEKRRRERRERREKRKREKEKQKKLKEESRSKKRRKHEHHDEREEQLDGSEGENELDAEMDEGYGRDEKKRAKQLEIVPSREPATKEEFEKYRDEVLSRVPKNVKKRFREGGFSKWGANMLPVLEIGPFDVEPGPVRDMWMDMYNNTRKSGREMTRLVFWYGVKFEDRGQAYSFIPSKNIISYEEGQEKGYCEMPRKLRKKVADKKKLSKTEEQIRRGLKEITEDMQRPKSERIKWMMKFQEDWELPDVDEEEPEEEVDSPEPLPKKAKKIIADEIRAELEQPIKRKPGRPKKADKEREEKARREKIAMLEQIEREERLEKEKNDGKVEKSGKSKKKSSTAKKFTIIDEDQDSDVESIEDRDDKSYNGGESSDDNVCDAEESDASNKEEIKPEPDENPQKQLSETDGRKNKKKPKEEMTPEELEEEKNRERERQQTYRENRKKKRAAELGIEYIPGERLQKKKSKKKLLQEEQTKFTRCEDIFLPTMDGLRESKEKSDAELALKHLSIILKNVQLLTPAFVRAYSIGVLVKSVRKFFESSNSKVKEECKRATVEMKRVFSEKEAKEPEGFQPKIRDISIKSANGKDEVEGSKRESISDSDFPSRTDSPHQSKEESEFPTDPSFSNAPPKPAESTSMRTNDVTTSNQIHSSEPSTSLGKVEAPKPSRNVFSIKGMFDKPKPAPIPKPKVTPNTPSSGQVTPKPKILPSWVTGPAVKVDDFHEQHAKERNFALEFLVDATSPSSSEKFDCVSVSRAFELAIFAETKLRGRDWKTYWEKVHDIVAMLSPGRDQSNAILQGIIVGDYPDPSELVKLSRREIHSLNSRRLK